tara:strand:- start:2 stop:535 length:534 start_codon:yes stop_codon:yes gene_type:complete
MLFFIKFSEILKNITSVSFMTLLAISILSNEVSSEEKNDLIFDDWQKVCDNESGNCNIFTFGYDSKGEKRARVTISPSSSEVNKKIAEMTILSPLYSYLPHGIITIVQDNEPIRHEFAFCAKEGCINFIPLMQQDVNMLKKEWNLSLVFQDYRYPSEKVFLDVSLVGFKKAFETLTN